MGELETAAVAKVAVAAELHKASMVTLFGVTFNIYAAILIVLFAVFLIAVYRAQRAQRFDWMDMITRDGTKVSATKILQLVGGVVGTWIVVKLTLQGQLDWDIFAIYLAYVASIDGFSKFILAKYGAHASDESAVGDYSYGRGRYGYDAYDSGSRGYRGAQPRNKQKPAVTHNQGGETPETDSPEDFAEDIELNGGAKTD